MAVTNIGRLIVCVHSDKPPSALEWNDYLSVTSAASASVGGDFGRIRTIVFTDGGGPNTVQRAAVNKLIGEKPSPGAIITQSAVVRGIVTALSWFNPAIQAFHPRDVGQGLKHLGLAVEDAEKLWPTLKTLQAKVQGVEVVSQVAQM